MSRYLKSYKMKLVSEGPVFVGNGKEIGKKEYIFLDKSHVGVIDIEKFYRLVMKLNLSHEFEKFMVKDTRSDLKHWVIDNNIKNDILMSCMRYILDSGDVSPERGTRIQIMQCAKDAYGNPYIPGSSIKGLLRTILLDADISKNFTKYRFEKDKLAKSSDFKKNRKLYLKREIEEIEGKCYRILKRDEKKPMSIVNDIMAGLIISDSEPLSIDDIVLCQKIEKHVDGGEKKLNLLRECIRPEIDINFTITIDESISDMKIDDIIESISVYDEDYYSEFKSKFPDTDRLKGNEVYLGGGSGYAGKTVINSLFKSDKNDNIHITQKIFKQTGVSDKHKHDRDIEYGVSPHVLKCTRYHGKLYEMGLCKMEVL